MAKLHRKMRNITERYFRIGERQAPKIEPANLKLNAKRPAARGRDAGRGYGKDPSNKLADYYTVEHPPLQGHHALDDAFSVSYTLQYLLRAGKLRPEAFEPA